LDKQDANGLIWLVVGFFILSSIGDWGWFNAAWYAVRYHVNPSNVQVDNRPKDCDYMHAPMGRKECHYEVTATAFNAAGQVIHDRAKYIRNANGKAIISYDDGKTWVWDYGNEISDRRIKSVFVTWSKATD
jgi:hypothetical protein